MGQPLVSILGVTITPNPVEASKNLFGGRVYPGFINYSSGKIETSSQYPNSVYGDPFPVKKDSKYYISGYYSDYRFRFFNSDGTYYTSLGTNSNNLVTSPIDGYVIPLFYMGLPESYLGTVQIEEGEAATTYKAPVQFKISVEVFAFDPEAPQNRLPFKLGERKEVK